VLRFGLAALALVLLSGIGGKVASAASGSCADQVIADWYDDGRVGKIYPLACYQQAIKKLPPDVLDYSNAKEEIGRALAFARQGKPDPGGQDPTPVSPNSVSTNTTSTPTTSTGTSTTRTTKTTPETMNVFTPGTTSTDTSGPSSVPVPLLVLGGLAILLLAAGSAGYLRRRMSGGGSDGSPPADA
jgi:hypothetical protein